MSHDRGCPCGKEPYEYEDCKQHDCRKKEGVSKMNTDKKHVELYVLCDWDGAEGMRNPESGLVTDSKYLAEEWVKRGTGNSYKKVSGVMVNSSVEFVAARNDVKRMKALNKLTREEKRLLGLL